ncbi:MAG TPA: APC family permease [Patescibacteria group bacterium]|nr:APC family permease [Patescibacteria group bacterium]
MMNFIRRQLLGKPMDNKEMANETLPKWKALAIFSSDALSSVAYGPEQIMLILSVPGLLLYGYLGPVSITILILLTIVTTSYVQVAKANPAGGGSYAAAQKNLGEIPALTAAASLFADYTLTVAVSVTAGTAAITAAFPAIAQHDVIIDLVVLFFLLMLINLRGVQESANAFVIPTYSFIFGIIVLLLWGFYQSVTQPAPLIPMVSQARQWDWTVPFILLRAFANGCSSMTGIEAISNGVPMFQKPQVHNAAVTTYWMSGILGFMFIGISFLIMHFHILPLAETTALSQVAEITFGRNWLYYYIQITTMLVLYLAANTSFNGLPALLSILAKDGYMPRYLASRGDRLSFSNGIILLSAVAGVLIVAYHGNTEHLISLYAIGVFVSFTIAQIGMVVHWFREKGKGWYLRAAINMLGGVTTGVVVLIIAITKFFYGAWLVLLFIPIMICLFRKIRGHYNDVLEQLSMPIVGEKNAQMRELDSAISETLQLGKNIVIVPIAELTAIVARTLKYARVISTDVTALHIAIDKEAGKRVAEQWKTWNPGVPLVTIYSPYRTVIQPLIDYIIEREQQKQTQDYVTVLIPEFETKKWWHRLLHNQSGWILRTLLILREDVIITTIPFHLKK